VAEVVAASARRFAVEAAHAVKSRARKRAQWLAGHLNVFAQFPEARRAALDAGLARTLARWAAGAANGSPPEDIQLAAQAVYNLNQLEPGEAEMRRVAVPLLSKDMPPDVRGAAIGVLGARANPWAIDLLLDLLEDGLEEVMPDRLQTARLAAGALANIGDARVIPRMIALLVAHESPRTIGDVTAWGLGRLTGVPFDPSHDGAWWEKNREKYPEAVRSLEIPDPPKRPLGEEEMPAAAGPAAKAAGVAAQDLRAGRDEKKRYFLIGAGGNGPPAAGYGVLVVLPGGDGSAEFLPFVRRIREQALDDRWVVAQAVAPKWDDDQFPRVVWPTDGLPYAAARFTTEELIRAIIADVRARVKVDPRRVFLLGWSSGGPPCYATALDKDSGVAAAFVAMSTFKLGQLPVLSNARGKAFFLLQSPQDRVTPIRRAEAAETALRAAGATVRLQRYDGGHGWRGDEWGGIREGIRWLDQQVGPR
jgi:predicted esterase